MTGVKARRHMVTFLCPKRSKHYLATPSVHRVAKKNVIYLAVPYMQLKVTLLSHKYNTQLPAMPHSYLFMSYVHSTRILLYYKYNTYVTSCDICVTHTYLDNA